MANTYVDYTAGVPPQNLRDFTIDFSYISYLHVKVKVNGSDRSDFTVVIDGQNKIVRFDSDLTVNDAVHIYRDSAAATALVDFENGSVLTESELDLAYLHNLYLSEENKEQQDRANHTGTQLASTISDFDTEVANNSAVAANTAKVSADGLVTTHSDVTSAGSGAIITSTERTKLNGIAEGATANSSDATLLDRANHTGTQLASTISDFDTEVASLLLDEDDMASNSATQAATQQSIKAYIDSLRYSSGWVNQDDSTPTRSLGVGAALGFTHNLGTTDVSVTVWAAEDANGTGRAIQDSVIFYDNGTNNYYTRGVQVSYGTENRVYVQVAASGYYYNNGSYVKKEWGTGTDSDGNARYSHIKVVVQA